MNPLQANRILYPLIVTFGSDFGNECQYQITDDLTVSVRTGPLTFEPINHLPVDTAAEALTQALLHWANRTLELAHR
ncbi:MAG: hypothetical protein OXI12_06680 [Gammaproteobacteria bacterium]|nr:hypothetical protein [Gammaproteobacteria bacterium]